jgi:hypothetical protein
MQPFPPLGGSGSVAALQQACTVGLRNLLVVIILKEPA